MRMLYIAVGGCVGTLARYWLAGVVQRFSGGEFPAGILVVNILGSFVLGVIMGLSLERGLSEDMRLALSVGLCGGFTTMSQFSYQTMALLEHGNSSYAVIYIAATFVVCLAAVWLGGAVGRVV
jgi:CrcB protein